MHSITSRPLAIRRLAGCVVATSVFLFGLALPRATAFDGGDGSAGNPYLVATAGHLDAVRNHLGAHFLQTADIDLGAAPWNEGAGWVPIGTSTTGARFTGTYHGGGKAVSNLFINRGTTDYQGLFGYTQGARIEHLEVRDFTITVRARSGGLAGQIDAATVVSHCRSSGTLTGSNRCGGLVGLSQVGSRIEHSRSSATVTAASERIGGLLGQNLTDSVVADCVAGGAVTGTTSVGGLVGRSETRCVVERSYASGRTQGTTSVGGLIGYQADGVVAQCFASGEVVATGTAGGLLGQALNSTVGDGHAAGQVGASGNDRGGLIGLLTGGRTERCFSRGAVTGTGSNLGGLIGRVVSGPVMVDCHWDREASGLAACAGLPETISHTTGEMTLQATYPGWDFAGVWAIGGGGPGYPWLRALGGEHAVAVSLPGPFAAAVVVTGLDSPGQTLTGSYDYQAGEPGQPEGATSFRWLRATTAGGPFEEIPGANGISHILAEADANRWLRFEVTVRDSGGNTAAPQHADLLFTAGDGTAAAPFLVGNAMQLSRLSLYTGTALNRHHFRLSANIDLGAAPWNQGGGWTPVGPSTSRFGCRLDGAGHTIANLTITRAGTTYQGLFGYTEGAVVRDLTLTAAAVGGGQYCGILAGYAAGGSIVNVSAAGTVTGSSSHCGGLLGYGNAAVLCTVAVDTVVSGTTNIGGLAGLLSGGEVRFAEIRGSVTGSSTSVGGLAGYVATTVLVDNHSRAAVTGSGQVGGFIGYFYTGTASRCFSTGAVVSGGTFIGGFSGRNSSATAIGCLWDTEASGQAASAHGEGRATAQMRQQANYLRYNFQAVWQIDEGTGYPALRNIASYPQPAGVALADLPGSGTANDPYLIGTPDELNAMRQNPAAHYRLVNDIDLTRTAAWDTGRGWEPVAGSAAGTRFTGGLDGAGFALRHLVVCRPTSSYQSLFSYLEGATVRNLTLEHAHLHASQYCGILAGYANGGTIENVSASGLVHGTSAHNGGLFGYGLAAVVAAVEVEASVLGTTNIGGLAGYLSGGEVRYAAVRGSVDGSSTSVGGLAGYVTTTVLVDNHSRTAVTGGGIQVGGFIGFFNTGTASRCFSTGLVTSGGTYVGGFSGRTNSASAHDCLWDKEASGQETSAHGEGRTTAQMRQQATYPRYNFQTVWQIDEGVAYPELREVAGYPQPPPVVLAELAGAGTAADPYRLATPGELNAMRQNPAAHYRLANDIDLSQTAAWDSGRGWTPVGGSAAGTRFTGSFDGAGFVLRNLVVNRPTTTYQGFFGYLDGARVRNLTIEGAHVQGAQYTGGLAGYANAAVLHNLRVDVSLFATSTQIGGLVGHLNGGMVRHSGTSGAVVGTTSVGGLAGYLATGAVSDCFNRATVSGTSQVGGLIGYHYSGSIFRSHSDGPVAFATTYGGGLTGRGVPASTLDCYWDTEASGMATSAGGTGLDSAAMRLAASFRNHNFTTLWQIDEGQAPPTIRPLHHLPQPQPVALANLDGSGTPEDPYLIDSPDALNAMRQDLTAHYALAADIDLAASVGWNDGEGWLPVGGSAQRFAGGLDGADHAIRNLTINRPTTTYQGLFGYTSGASIANLRLDNTQIQASSFAAAIAGLALNSHITTCSSLDHLVVGRGGHNGGLVGHQNGGAIRHVAVRSTTVGLDRTGGVVGYLSGANALLQYASSHGRVEGALSVGGLVGELNNASAVVADGFSHADIVGTDRCGGLLGYLNGGAVRRCYSIGATAATGSFTGGFLGRLASGTVRSSYWDAQRSGMISSAAGQSRTTAEMTYPHDQDTTYIGWNFRQWWSEDGDLSLNGGYPYLRTDLPPFDVFANSIQLDAFPTVVCEVAVIARDGSPVTGLTAANFTVTEQGPDDPEPIPCAVTVEEIPAEDATITVVLVFDTSGSMGAQQMADAKDAAISFIGNLQPGDKVGVVEFKSSVIVRTEPIGDLDAVITIIQSLTAGGGTAMFDGIYDAVSLLENLTGSRSVIVFTDGADTSSTHNKNDTIEHALQVGVPVFTIALGAGVGQQNVLEEIADATGGAFFNAPEASDLFDIYMQIAIAQRPQYRVTYTSPHPEVDGTLRAVHISVTYDGVTVTDRRSYGIARTIIVAADPAGAGTPGGGGLYADGSLVTLTPNPAVGWDFVEWSENGVVVSTDAQFTFEVRGDRSFTAHYQTAIHTLTYQAGPGGTLTGPTVQQVPHGSDATTVTAEPVPGAVFFIWSDGVPTAGRTDTQVQAPLAVTARFRSTGGVDIDWYLTHGFEPGAGETWADLDGKDPTGKGTTLLEDFLAGTDPRDPASRFDAKVNEVGAGGEITLDWFSAPGRTYGIEWSEDLAGWSEVEAEPGLPLRVEASADSRTSIRLDPPVVPPGARLFFRVKVIP